MSRRLQPEGPVQLATSVLKIKFYWNLVSPVRFHGVCGRLQAASAGLHGGWDGGCLAPKAFGCFSYSLAL